MAETLHLNLVFILQHTSCSRNSPSTVVVKGICQVLSQFHSQKAMANQIASKLFKFTYEFYKNYLQNHHTSRFSWTRLLSLPSSFVQAERQDFAYIKAHYVGPLACENFA